MKLLRLSLHPLGEELVLNLYTIESYHQVKLKDGTMNTEIITKSGMKYYVQENMTEMLNKVNERIKQ